MVDKFSHNVSPQRKAGFGKMRVMTDYAGERYWTIVAEFEVESMDAMEAMMRGEGISPELGKEFEKVMEAITISSSGDDGRCTGSRACEPGFVSRWA